MIQIDMEMPSGCHFCPIAHWTCGTNEFSGCEITHGKKYAMFNDPEYANSPVHSRPAWCPLKEIAANHGRLIDADALKEKLKHAIPTYPLAGCATYADTDIMHYIDAEPSIEVNEKND